MKGVTLLPPFAHTYVAQISIQLICVSLSKYAWGYIYTTLSDMFFFHNNPEPMDGNFTIFNQKNKIRGKKQNNKIQELIYSRFLKLKPSLQNYNALREFISESISVASLTVL